MHSICLLLFVIKSHHSHLTLIYASKMLSLKTFNTVSPPGSDMQLQTEIKAGADWAWRHPIDWLPATLRPSFIHLFDVGSFLNAIQVI